MPPEIEVAELAARLAAGLPTVLVDVREPWEVAHACIEGSINIPLGELAMRAAEIPADPDAVVVTICHLGVRSLRAAAMLHGTGRADVRSLAGGIDAWAVSVEPGMARY